MAAISEIFFDLINNSFLFIVNQTQINEIGMIALYYLKQSLIGSRLGLNPGLIKLKSPALPSELPCFGQNGKEV